MSDNFFAELDSELGQAPKPASPELPAIPTPIPRPEAKKPPLPIQKQKPQLKPTTPMNGLPRPALPPRPLIPKKPMMGKPML
jgi:hypothetical protein